MADARLQDLFTLFRAGLLGLACTGAQAERGPPLWELGVAAGAVSQQAYPGADESVERRLLLPYAVYRGQRLRADDQGAGLRAVRGEGFELDVSFAGALSAGGRPLRAREGMARLGTRVEFGPVARWFLNGRSAGWTFELPLRGVFDARDLRRHRGMSLEPELSLERRVSGGWRWGLGLAALLGDGRLGASYYGVAPDEALPERPAYAARAGLIAWRLKGGLARQLTPDLRLFAFGRLDSVAGAANRDSPLVRRTTGASVGIGLSYVLQRSVARVGE